MKELTIGIVGAGAVGSTTAYALLLKGIAAEIIIVDCDQNRCAGEVFDLEDVLPLSVASRVKAGDLRTVAQADIIIIAAGKRQQPGQSRAELLQSNTAIIQEIMHDMQPISKDAIIIMVSNPVDSMTLCAQTFSGLPRSQVFGSGTFLDSQRLRIALAGMLDVAEESVHAFVLGEHGPTQFPWWSHASVAGIPLHTFKKITAEVQGRLAQTIREKAGVIIEKKHATYYGVAACVATLCEIINFDQKMVVPVSCYQEDAGVCLSIPVVLGRTGIERHMAIDLHEQEKKQLAMSIQELKQYCGIVTCGKK